MSTRSIILGSLAFVVGAAGGAVAGYFFGKNKFLSQADKEIESVRKMYEKYFNNKKPEVVESKKPTLKDLVNTEEPSEKDTYKNYTNMYAGKATQIEGNEIPKRSIPAPQTSTPRHKTNSIYIISPEQFRESEYPTETLIYYSDRVLADEDGNVIHNVNEVIGPEALSTFGRYEDDCVYVRDDDKQIDYEIIWESRSYPIANKNSGSKEPLGED